MRYSTFWWRKHDIKVIHFSLLKVVWSNFRKLESVFVEFKGQINSDAFTTVSILACILLIKLYKTEKNSSGPCPNLNVSTFKNAKLWPHFVRAIVQHHVDLLKESWVSVKTWIIKYCRRLLKKSISPVLLGLTSPLKRENSL